MTTTPATQTRYSSATFEAAFESFDHCLTTVAQRDVKEFEQSLSTFEAEYEAARVQRAATTPHLKILEVFGLTARELSHSRALAWFLRENSEHEQGALFMRALLRSFGLVLPARTRYVVELERPDRVDISIHAPGVFAIFIENKVYAREQPEQFTRLVESLVTLSLQKCIPKNARIAVFLTDDGRRPNTGPKAGASDVVARYVRRLDVFNLFAKDLHDSLNKSPLLVDLLDAYVREINYLT